MFRYSVVYADPHGAGDARPTALTVVKDEDLVGKLTDKVMLITGGSAGIGAETARAFHATGAKLFLTIAKGRQFSDDTSNRTEIILIKMELYPLDSVRAGAQQVLRRTGRLNVLVNNAGVKAMPQGGTKEGFETQFGTNHLAHFFLFQVLKVPCSSPARWHSSLESSVFHPLAMVTVPYISTTTISTSHHHALHGKHTVS